MSRPVVALLSRTSDSADTFSTPVVAAGIRYAHAVVRAGGAPLVVPRTTDDALLDATLQRCDGILAMGGGDVDPSLYGEVPHEKVYNVDIENDLFEISAIKWAVAHNIPTLAICRGHQVLNVALGGSLIQHLDTAADHRGKVHEVEIEADSRIARALGTTVSNGYSWHHQAIKSVAPSLRVVGLASDDTVEAVEHRDARWIVGVQWHPERTAEDDPVQQALFNEFVRECAGTAR
jgi:putative glutamine amidotransferase